MAIERGGSLAGQGVIKSGDVIRYTYDSSPEEMIEGIYQGAVEVAGELSIRCGAKGKDSSGELIEGWSGLSIKGAEDGNATIELEINGESWLLIGTVGESIVAIRDRLGMPEIKTFNVENLPNLFVEDTTL